jgi:predicted transcriptional regulator
VRARLATLNRKKSNKEEMKYNMIRVRDDKYVNNRHVDYRNINYADYIDYGNINHNNLVYSKSGILRNNSDSFIRQPEIFLTMKKMRSCKNYLQSHRIPEVIIEQRRLQEQRRFKPRIDKQQYTNNPFNNNSINNNFNFNYQKMSNNFSDEFMTSKNYKQFDNFSKNCRKDVYGLPMNTFSFKKIRIQDLYTKIIKSITENITFLIIYNFLETKDYSGILFRSLENVLPIYLISGYIYLCRYLKCKMSNLKDLSKIFFICCWISAKTTHDKHIPFDEMFINTDICTKDISYIEAHILSKINYDIEIYQEEVLRYIW